MYSFNLAPEYYKSKSPDRLIMDFKRRQGEFSINWDINFERYLEKIEARKKAGTYRVINFLQDYHKDIKTLRKHMKKRITGK